MPGQRLTVMAAALAGAIIFVACVPADDQASGFATTEPHQFPASSADLGYTARIEFKLIHPDDTPTFFTHSTGGEFTINEDISEPNHEHSLQFNGTVTRISDREGVLLQYDVEALHADLNEGFEAVHSASGSAFMTPGQSRSLTLLGDAALQVTVTRDD